MVQATSAEVLSSHISELARIAEQLRGIPHDIASEAASATRAALADCPGASRRVLRRAESYFWAVVRRKLLRMRRGTPAAARFVLAAVVADLKESGRDAEAVWDELQRGWSDKVPREILEEFRLRLCA